MWPPTASFTHFSRTIFQHASVASLRIFSCTFKAYCHHYCYCYYYYYTANLSDLVEPRDFVIRFVELVKMEGSVRVGLTVVSITALADRPSLSRCCSPQHLLTLLPARTTRRKSLIQRQVLGAFRPFRKESHQLHCLKQLRTSGALRRANWVMMTTILLPRRAIAPQSSALSFAQALLARCCYLPPSSEVATIINIVDNDAPNATTPRSIDVAAVVVRVTRRLHHSPGVEHWLEVRLAFTDLCGPPHSHYSKLAGCCSCDPFYYFEKLLCCLCPVANFCLFNY